jgi:hypothetical protein
VDGRVLQHHFRYLGLAQPFAFIFKEAPLIYVGMGMHIVKKLKIYEAKNILMFII